jgi:hypothetical protein
MILFSKVFQKFKEPRHFSRKQNFWPEEAKNAPCSFKIASRLYMAAARFSQAANKTPCFAKIAARPLSTAARFWLLCEKKIAVGTIRY